MFLRKTIFNTQFLHNLSSLDSPLDNNVYREWVIYHTNVAEQRRKWILNSDQKDILVGAGAIDSPQNVDFTITFGGVDFIIYIVGTDVLLQFGHATALTSHCDVIHYRVAASLPRRSVKHRLYIIYGDDIF